MDPTKERLANSDEEAADQAKRWISENPFPDLPKALLSAGHILEYARVTGMLFPFDENQLKAASYEAYIAGEVIWWDEKRERKTKEVKGRTGFLDLEPNSITFVQIEPKFRLPNYMAVRFNLRISHVHRGLLLGTGPLVDPGFEGRLLVPLHNLTASRYHLDLSKALIWIEFTLTTFGLSPALDKDRFLFPKGGKNTAPNAYLFKASGGEPIVSSIPEATRDARDRAAAAEASLATVRNIGILAFFGAVFGISSVVYSSISVTNTIGTQMVQLHQVLEGVQKDVGGLLTRVSTVEGKVSSREPAADLLKPDLPRLGQDGSPSQAEIALQARVDELTRRLDSLTQPHPGSKGGAAHGHGKH